MRRNPMDSCYAMYKTLFRMGYPFSYSLDNLAHYYEAYEGLMRHWQAMLPGRVYDIDYEDLVQNPEQVSRNIVAHCGLDWQAECLDFHLNKSPTATASAAQVRRPINRDSVEKWRAYADELQPLKQALEAAGIKIKKASA
ncbi:MAG: sulfotransferase [Alphaproteobacteria bacterium]|nr:sulfotransferase [Alphaproteobacteria bacterium]